MFPENEDELPRVEFDDSRAIRCFPIPNIKWAAKVIIPQGYPTFIFPEWAKPGDEPQVFASSYYLMLDERGEGRYGSAEAEWLSMHTRLPLEAVIGVMPAVGWVKTQVPTGYEVSSECLVHTHTETGSRAGLRESWRPVRAGTLVLRQPNGEIQFVRPEDRERTYYSHERATELDLARMTDEQFAAWAVQIAMRGLRASIKA